MSFYQPLGGTMNSSVETQQIEQPEKDLWMEVIKIALCDWGSVYWGTNKNFQLLKKRGISLLKQELNWFFFEPKPQECNLSWIALNIAVDGEALKAAVSHALETGVLVRPGHGRVKKQYRLRKK